MRLTPDVLAASYTFLRSTLPFKRWKLPEAEEVEFHVKRFRHTADAVDLGHKVVIRFNEHGVSLTGRLIEVMAHEMVHLRIGDFSPSSRPHGKTFRRVWRQVCRQHGFDPLDI